MFEYIFTLYFNFDFNYTFKGDLYTFRISSKFVRLEFTV